MVRHKHQTFNTGLSLVELVLVVCIIGIFAAVATIPFSRATTEAQLINAADRLVTDLTMVRDQALREQKPYSLIFHPVNLSYRATGVTDTNNANDIFVNLITDDRYQLASIEFDLDDSSKTITFNKLGFPTTEGDITLIKGSREITIKIKENGKIEPSKPK